MLGKHFQDRGWDIVTGPAKPTLYQVFGERSSGTNFVKRLMGRNSPIRPTEDLGWKHGFPHMTAIPAHVLIIACVRDARAWSLSMHSKPWHCPPEMQSLGYSDFIRARWDTIADRKRYFPQVQELGGQGQLLQHDRHPLTGLPFETLFALRRAKLAGLLSFYNRGCNLVFCRMEDVIARPQEFLHDVHTAFQAPVTAMEFRPVHKRLGSKFAASVEARPDTPLSLSAADLDFLRSQIDPAQESALGYSYD